MYNSTTKNIILIDQKQFVPKEFNRISSKYDFATGLSQGYQGDLNYSASLLCLKGDEIVLDVCCGTGKSTKAILPYITTGTIIGIDNSEGMLEVAEAKFSEEIKSGKTSFQLMDAMDLKFPDASFDAIFMAYGLRNMPDYEANLTGLLKLLKPGGRLVIHDYSLSDSSLSKPIWWVLGWVFIVPFCSLVSGSSKIYTYLVKSVFKFLSPKDIKPLMEKVGFEDVRIYRHKGWRKPILHSFLGRKTK